jgi:hypothetical protein
MLQMLLLIRQHRSPTPRSIEVYLAFDFEILLDVSTM